MPGFTLETVDGATTLYLPFNDAAPKSLGGNPVIARVVRPKVKSLTEYTNQEPQQLQISWNLDAFAEADDNVNAAGELKGAQNEAKIRKLERLWGIDGSKADPPHLIVTGDPAGSIPYDSHDAPDKVWWLEDIQEDDGTLRNKAGNRIRVSGTILLTEVVEDEGLDVIKVGKKKAGAKAKHYTVKKGDTLAKIAARLKIKGGWKALQKLNPNIRDPKSIKPGDRIRIS